ncbi:MAG TPA: GGDEF domain-containing protein [Magnetospirillaceae bacterium]|nr:GGDEF domain-containing protein [Magnetospirillaceae bacterium]
MHDAALEAFADRWLDADLYRLRRAARDLYARALRGGIYYAAASIVFLLTIGGPAELPLAVWLAPLAYATLAALRYLNKVPETSIDPAEYRRWRFRHWLIIDIGCVLWSGHLLAAGLLAQPYSITLTLALLCCFAYSSAICHAFAMNRRAAYLSLTLLGLPAIAFACFFHEGLPIAIGLAVQTSYSMVMLDRANKDYELQVTNEHALLLSRTETERLVRTDVLTGLANRREYEKRFEQAWHIAARQGGDLALLVIDLDFFKQLNDTYGHAAGDACLRHFAQILAQQFRRAGDLCARIGGEEFAVILSGASAFEAAKLGQDFSDALIKSPCQYRDQQITITASIGAGAADWDSDPDPVATFARIDQACYEAKKQGRSRLVAV